jgi:tetratricopeptide (TPR) repeat protein
VPPAQKPDRFWRWFAVAVFALIAIPFLISIVGLLAAIAIPNFVKARVQAQANARHAATQTVVNTFAVQLAQEGWQLWQQHKLAEAEKKFQQAVALAPGDADAWNGLGWAQFNAGNSAAAETTFQKAVRLEPPPPGAWNGLGQIYLSQGKFAEAETCLLKAAPQAPAAWFGLARIYLLQGKFADAEKWAQKIVDSGQADETTRKMLEAAKSKKLNDELRLMLEPQTVASGFSFGPVMERELPFEGGDTPGLHFIGFKSGQVITLSLAALAPGTPEALENWMRENGADAVAEFNTDGSARLFGFKQCLFIESDTNAWMKTAAQQLTALWADSEGHAETRSATTNSLPDTFLFKTHEGVFGLGQITGFTENPRGVKIRYKLAQNGTNTPSATSDADSILSSQPPVVVETFPVSGARDVEPGETEIRVRFSKRMTDDSWSWSTAWENSAPEFIGQPYYEADGKTCVVKVKLEPNKTYAFWLNSEKFHNFKDAAGRPTVPYLLIFQTKPK